VRRGCGRERHRSIPRFTVDVTAGEESDFLMIEMRSSSPPAAALVANGTSRHVRR
jgi:hypothetical protein